MFALHNICFMDLIRDMGQGNLICKKYKIKKGVEKSTPFVLKAGT